MFLTNHDAEPSRSRYLRTKSPMYLLLQCWLTGLVFNMHGLHSEPTIGPRIIFSNLIGLLLGNHARAGATSSKCPAETARAVAIGYLDGDT